eukprot:4362229-Alexandrium_andersonii.AAC.1
MGLLKLQAAPQYSSPSMGSVERFHALLQAQIRTLLSDLEERFDYKADAASPITSWAVRHSSWLHGRCLQHASGKKTSYNRRWDRDDTSPICNFAGIVHFKKQESIAHKPTTSWAKG